MDHKLHIVLVEDEQNAIELMESLLARLENVVLDASFTNPEKGFDYLLQEQPDLVLLDIRMPKLSGFELVEKLREHGVHIPFVFVTAHDEYVLDALRKKAVDYLMKPVSMEGLRNTIEQFRSEEHDWQLNSRHNCSESLKQDYLKINTKSGFEILSIEDIICMVADGRYTIAVLTSGQQLTISQNLGCFDHLTFSQAFLRVHRSSIVNPAFLRRLNRIKRICYLEAGEIQYKVKVSMDGIKRLENFFNE